MNNFFEVDTVQLNNSAEALREKLAALRIQFSAMSQSVAELSGLWEGTAKQAFQVQFDKDYADFEDYCKSVSELIDSLETASREYDSCEDKVRAAVDAVRV